MSFGHLEHWDYDPERGEYVLPDPEQPLRCASCGLDLLACEAWTLTNAPLCGPCRDRVDALPHCTRCDGAFPASALRDGRCIPCTMESDPWKEPHL